MKLSSLSLTVHFPYIIKNNLIKIMICMKIILLNILKVVKIKRIQRYFT